MPLFDVWIEGYNVTGTEGWTRPQCLGAAIEADSFETACKMAVDTRALGGSYDAETNKVWGCRLYRSKEQAELAREPEAGE